MASQGVIAPGQEKPGPVQAPQGVRIATEEIMAMLIRVCTATALCLVMGLTPALAQPAGSPVTAAPPNAVTQQPGQWLADDLLGSSVYNQQNQRIGDLNDLVIGPDGRVVAFVVGVGGFLGIGERDVAIPFEQVQMRRADDMRGTGDTADRGSAAYPGATPGTAGGPSPTDTIADPGSTGAPAVPSGTASASRDLRLVANVTRDQLREMPAYTRLGAQDRGGRGDGGDARRPSGVVTPGGGVTGPTGGPGAPAPAGAAGAGTSAPSRTPQ